ncbi:hypothetical protein Q3W71_11445 [Micromonospora sp. C28SCA-DRY-2]|uniref:hypothetical protein n=1 Tax=Micromonospora sp. C28SCA-DRY-2 TaxID=3059522 RepID=UPI002675574F|nr:hypothetical protein [Micromonospora sp. C28SCA-DRY-2]MDO3702291.1 hypothetical protein [Micromonospora sp. C28SCA-DRY-2]
MKTRRLATTGVALVATLGLALTGCGNKTGEDTPAGNGATAAPASSAPADALGELSAAAQKLNEQSVRMNLKSSVMNGGGVLDPSTKTGDMTLNMGTAGKFRVVMVGDDAYLKVSGMAGLPNKWLHMDATKLGESGQLNLMPEGDPGGAKKLIDAVAQVEETSEGNYAGTLDYTRTMAKDKDIAALGEKAKAVPFTAKVDDQGRLTEIAIDVSVLHESLGTMTTTYSDFGTPVSVRKPAASETQEAPEELIKAFGA